jgi:lysyl-tRNA synthetase class 2
MGVDPYGGRFPDAKATNAIRQEAEALAIQPGERAELRGRVAGRIVLLRIMGKLAFATIRDERGTLQLGISKAEVGDGGWEVLKQLDLGDWIGADGVIGRSRPAN